MRDEMNWKIVAAITVAGIILAVGGLSVGGFDSASVSSLLLNLGTAVALIAVVVLVQPKLVRQVKRVVEGAAVQAADRATADIRERLEDLERLQLEQRETRRQEQDAEIDRLRTESLSPSTIGNLLAASHDEKLFDGSQFRVRTSTRPDAHVLYMLPLRAANEVRVMWLDFVPLEDSGEVDRQSGVPLPFKREATVIWVNDGPASEIASDLEAGLERLNEPLRGFTLAHALEQLVKSVQMMRAARAAEEGSPRRLRGTLRLLINERWAYTSFGLEAVLTAAAFPIRDAGFRGGPPASVWYKGCISDCARPEDEPETEWLEAVSWLKDREDFDIRAPGETQPHPVSRLFS